MAGRIEGPEHPGDALYGTTSIHPNRDPYLRPIGAPLFPEYLNASPGMW